jgi:hypothetical protein
MQPSLCVQIIIIYRERFVILGRRGGSRIIIIYRERFVILGRRGGSRP